MLERGGVKQGSVNVRIRPVKSNDCVSTVRTLLLPLDPSHVILAPLRKTSINSTKVLFSCSLIGAICILVVASAEVPIAHVNPKHVQLGSDSQYMKRLLALFRYTSML